MTKSEGRKSFSIDALLARSSSSSSSSLLTMTSLSPKSQPYDNNGNTNSLQYGFGSSSDCCNTNVSESSHGGSTRSSIMKSCTGTLQKNVSSKEVGPRSEVHQEGYQSPDSSTGRSAVPRKDSGGNQSCVVFNDKLKEAVKLSGRVTKSDNDTFIQQAHRPFLLSSQLLPSSVSASLPLSPAPSLDKVKLESRPIFSDENRVHFQTQTSLDHGMNARPAHGLYASSVPGHRNQDSNKARPELIERRPSLDKPINIRTSSPMHDLGPMSPIRSSHSNSSTPRSHTPDSPALSSSPRCVGGPTHESSSSPRGSPSNNSFIPRPGLLNIHHPMIQAASHLGFQVTQ